MSFFNNTQIKEMYTNEYPCPKCRALMKFEDEFGDTLVCPNCGYDEDYEHRGFTDEEYENLYPTKEEVCGYEEDEYNGESYEEVYGELSDD